MVGICIFTMFLFLPNPTNYTIYILFFCRSQLYFTRPTSILPGLRAGRGVRGLSREIGNGVLGSDWKVEADVPKPQTIYI